MRTTDKTPLSEDAINLIWDHNNEFVLALLELETIAEAFKSIAKNIDANLVRISAINQIGDALSEPIINARLQSVYASLITSQTKLGEIFRLELSNYAFLSLCFNKLEKLVKKLPPKETRVNQAVKNVKVGKIKIVEWEEKLEEHRRKFISYEEFVINNTNINSQVNNKKDIEVFLCYSSKDKSIILDLYKELTSAGYKPWLDSLDILAGQDWELEIRLAINRANYFIVCLSQNAVSREGYTQKEIKMGLDILDRMPDGKIYLIPVRLDNCIVPERLKSRQWVDLFEARGFDRLLKAMK